MNKIRSLILLIAFMATTACGSSSSGLDKLKSLCEKDAGLTINKTVEADGFYDTTEGNKNGYLVKKGYKFIEICSESAVITSSAPESGCWRFTKVKRVTEKCHKKIDKNMSKIVVEPYPEFIKEHCIAVEKIEKPEARYSYHSDPKQWVDKNGVSKFFRTDVYVKDNVTSEILGRFVSYTFDKNPRYSPTISCKRLGNKYLSFFEANLIQAVLKSMSKGVSHD